MGSSQIFVGWSDAGKNGAIPREALAPTVGIRFFGKA